MQLMNLFSSLRNDVFEVLDILKSPDGCSPAEDVIVEYDLREMIWAQEDFNPSSDAMKIPILSLSGNAEVVRHLLIW